MIKKAARCILANSFVRGCGRSFLMKYPKLRPYFFRWSRRLGLVQNNMVQQPICPVGSMQDLSPRAIKIYLQFCNKNKMRNHW